MRSIVCVLFALLLIGSPAVSDAASPESWVLIDTSQATLTVYSAAGQRILQFEDIAIGSGGVSDIHRLGDESTPRGSFKVAWVNRHSRFGLFFGLSYPTREVAEGAFQQGYITATEYHAILDAYRKNKLPPQNTALGGRLGIHGLGSGDPNVHKSINWTDGCVAITNRQIKQLSRWVHKGTRVIIR